MTYCAQDVPCSCTLGCCLQFTLLVPLLLLSYSVVEEPNGVFRLNLGRLVVGYTRSFTLTDPREALEYFYRLR